jgi:SM-20-related protein
MNRAAHLAKSETHVPGQILALDLLRAAPVAQEPFPFFIVPRFVQAEALDAIRADFPVIRHAGSFPLTTLEYGPAFAAFMTDIQSAEMTKLVGSKLNMDLSASPTMVTVRGQSRAKDGKIHTDSRTKLVTALIYMNDAWESPQGRLRLVRSETNLNDVIAEVPPDQGTLLVFRNDANAWHGFEPFAGPRRVIQLNWVTDASVVRREQNRHRVSAFFKRLSGQGM